MKNKPLDATASPTSAVGELKPHPQRDIFPEIDDLALEQLVADIAVRGILVPLVVTDKGVILSGHQRHRAALVLGLATVPTTVRTGLSEAEELRYLIQDNLRRRHLTPSQRAVLGTSPALAEVVATISKDAESRRAQGGLLAGRGRPQQLEAALPQAKGRSRAPATRDLVADLVGVKGRLITDARFCWNEAAEEVQAIAHGKSRATVSAIAGRIRKERALAEVKDADSDITDLVLNPGLTTSGEYAAKFYGITCAGKGFVAAWLVLLDEGQGFALFLQRFPDGRHPESGRLGRATALGTVVTAISGSSEATVDVRPFLGCMYRLTIAVKGKTTKIEKIVPDVPNAGQQAVDPQVTAVVSAGLLTTGKRGKGRKMVRRH